MARTIRVVGMVLLMSYATSPAQPAPEASDDRAADDQPRLRLTPGIARGMARLFVHEELLRRYEIDASREDELSELVARRIMEAAHEIDTPESQAAVGRLTGNALRMMVESSRHRRRFMRPELAQSLANDLLPVLPNGRELVRRLGQDIRPMLSMKQQLRLAADLVTLKTAMDGFEATMQRWAGGDVLPGDDPFDDHDVVEIGPDGVSKQVRQARQNPGKDDQLAQLTKSWEDYIDNASRFYGFDEAQIATARSVVRETTDRASAILNGPEFQAEDADQRFWLRFWRSLGPEFRGEQPVLYLLLRRMSTVQEPLNGLTDELKARVDRIARQEQQRAAEERMRAKLAELGQ